uniref:Protein kinase domain-containing protein n=1 Tax=Acrobeloides nanus TaxID=290746 RepID=A0A914E2W9_9BILA
MPKETCDFIKKYMRYEAEGTDGTVFKFGGLKHVGFAIKTLSNPEAISFYQDKGIDIWSFGVVLWEMLMREQPYKECRKAEFIVVPLLRQNLSLRPLPEMVPNVLKNLIKECLDRDPDRRPSFSEIVDTIPKIREAIIHIEEKSWHNISQKHIQIDNIDHWAAVEAAFSVLRDHSK